MYQQHLSTCHYLLIYRAGQQHARLFTLSHLRLKIMSHINTGLLTLFIRLTEHNAYRVDHHLLLGLFYNFDSRLRFS
nr:MAG TPA_asm: hypothetical protein [Caudoviricetes sp.]